MQPVPEGEAARPVGVRLLAHDRVVDAVHARRHEEPVEAPLGRDRQAHVRVVEHDRDERRGLPGREGERRHADQHHLRDAPPDRDHDLGEVEAQRRRGVEVEVHVVHDVKPPEERHAVREHVPAVERVVHEHDGEQEMEPGGQGCPAEEAPSPRLDPPRQRQYRRQLHEMDRTRAEGRDGEVAGRASQLGLDGPPEGVALLEPHEHEEGPGKEGPAHDRRDDVSRHMGTVAQPGHRE